MIARAFRYDAVETNQEKVDWPRSGKYDPITYRCNDEGTLLHFACRHGNSKLIRELLTYDIDVNAQNCLGDLAIDLLGLFNFRGIHNPELRLLQAEGSLVSPITGACFLSLQDFLKFPITSLLRKDHYARSPLFNAAFSGNADICEYLIRQGAEIGIFEAVLFEDIDTLRIIIRDNPLAIRERNTYCTGPLYYAKLTGNAEIIGLLEGAGADDSVERSRSAAGVPKS